MITMQFLPKKEEKYISIIRNHLQKRIVKKGITLSSLNLLRKIMLFKAATEMTEDPTDVADFCNAILGAATVEMLKVGIYTEVFISGYGIKYTDRNMLTVILLEIMKQCPESICIDISEKYIKITAAGKIHSGNIKRILKLHGGVALKCDGVTGFFIPSSDAKVKPTAHPDEWDYLLNPLSAVKIFISKNQ